MICKHFYRLLARSAPILLSLGRMVSGGADHLDHRAVRPLPVGSSGAGAVGGVITRTTALDTNCATGENVIGRAKNPMCESTSLRVRSRLAVCQDDSGRWRLTCTEPQRYSAKGSGWTSLCRCKTAM